jgi:hypothetical protein
VISDFPVMLRGHSGEPLPLKREDRIEGVLSEHAIFGQRSIRYAVPAGRNLCGMKEIELALGLTDGGVN